MDRAYRHHSRLPDGRPVEGTVYARDADRAWYRLRTQFGLQPGSLRLQPWATLQLWWAPALPAAGLVAFYRALGRRLERGEAIQPGLAQAQEYVAHRPLQQAIAILAHGLREGLAMGPALRNAGFPVFHAAALDACAQTGHLPATLQRLATELERRLQLDQGLRQALQMPLTVLAVLYAGLLAALIGFLPVMGRFYRVLGARDLPPFAAAWLDLADHLARHRALVVAVWALLPLAGVMAWQHPAVRQWRQRLPMAADWYRQSALAAGWGTFAVLYDAGVQVEEACRLLAQAAGDPLVARAFRQLGLGLRAGWPLVQAVARAGFPAAVQRGVQAADSSGDIVAGLNTLAESLTGDLLALGLRQQHWLRVGSTLAAAVLVAGFFLLTYYPILAATFAQL